MSITARKRRLSAGARVYAVLLLVPLLVGVMNTGQAMADIADMNLTADPATHLLTSNRP